MGCDRRARLDDKSRSGHLDNLCPPPSLAPAMIIVHVHVQVKEECLAAFCEATLANARASVLEPGVARFDVIRREDDPARFTLVEVYRDAAAVAAHKETAHYATWRDQVAPMMAVPRYSEKFHNLFPDDSGWSA